MNLTQYRLCTPEQATRIFNLLRFDYNARAVFSVMRRGILCRRILHREGQPEIELEAL